MSSSRQTHGARAGDSPPFTRLQDTRAYREPPRNPFELRASRSVHKSTKATRSTGKPAVQVDRHTRPLESSHSAQRSETGTRERDPRDASVANIGRSGQKQSASRSSGDGSWTALHVARAMREITVGRVARAESNERYRTPSFSEMIPSGIAPGDAASLQARLEAIRRGTDGSTGDSDNDGQAGLPGRRVRPGTAGPRDPSHEPEGPAGDATDDGLAVPPQDKVWLRRVEVEADAAMDAVQSHRGGKLTLPISSPASATSARSTPVNGDEEEEEEDGNEQEKAQQLQSNDTRAYVESRRHQQRQRPAPRQTDTAQSRDISQRGYHRDGQLGGRGDVLGSKRPSRQRSRAQGGQRPTQPVHPRRLKQQHESQRASGAHPSRHRQQRQGRRVDAEAQKVLKRHGWAREQVNFGAGDGSAGRKKAQAHRQSQKHPHSGKSVGRQRGSNGLLDAAPSPSARRSVRSPGAGGAEEGARGEEPPPSNSLAKQQQHLSPPQSPQRHRAGRFGVDPPEQDRVGLPMSPRRTRRRHDLTKGSQHNALVAVRRMRLLTQLAVAEDDEGHVLPGSPRVKPTAGAARYLFEGGRLPPSMLARGSGNKGGGITRVPMEKPPAHLLRKPKAGFGLDLQTDHADPAATGAAQPLTPTSAAAQAKQRAARAAERRNARMLRAVSSLAGNAPVEGHWSEADRQAASSLRTALAREQRSLRMQAGALSPRMARRRAMQERVEREHGDRGGTAAPAAIDAGTARLLARADAAIESDSEDQENHGSSASPLISRGAKEWSSPASAVAGQVRGVKDEQGEIPAEAFAEVSKFLQQEGGSADGTATAAKRVQRGLMPFEQAAERLCGSGSVRAFDAWRQLAIKRAEEASLRVRDVRDGLVEGEGNQRLQFALDRCPPAWRLFMSLYEDKILMKHASSVAVAFRAWKDRATQQFKLRRALVAFVRPKMRILASSSLRRWCSLTRATQHRNRRLLTKIFANWRALRAVTIWRRERLVRKQFNVWNVATKECQQQRAAMRLAHGHFFRRKAALAIQQLALNVSTEREERRRVRNANVFLFVHRGRDYVRRWVQYTAAQRAEKQLHKLAEDYYVHRHAKQLVGRWRRRTHKTKLIRRVMQKVQRGSARRFFNAWRGAAAETARERLQMVDAGIYHGLRLTLRVFCAWRDSAMDRIRDKAAARAFELRSERRALRLWRRRAAVTVSLRARGVVASAGRAGRLVSAAWSLWKEALRLQECEHRLHAWKRERSLRRGVDSLLEFATERQDARDKAERARLFARFRLYRSGWLGFKATAHEARLERAAVGHHARAICSRAMSAWKAEAKRAAGVRALQLKFEVALRRVRTHEMLQFWRRWSRNRRWGRSATAVADVFRRRVSLGGAWVGLAHHVALKKRARDAAERILVRRELTSVRKCLRGWHSRTFRWEMFARKVALRRTRVEFFRLLDATKEAKRARQLDMWVLNMQRERLQSKAFARWVRYVQVVAVERTALDAAEDWHMRRLGLRVIARLKSAVRQRREAESEERKQQQEQATSLGQQRSRRSRGGHAPQMVSSRSSSRSRASNRVVGPVSTGGTRGSKRRTPPPGKLGPRITKRPTARGLTDSATDSNGVSMVAAKANSSLSPQSRGSSPDPHGADVVMLSAPLGLRPAVLPADGSRSPGPSRRGRASIAPLSRPGSRQNSASRPNVPRASSRTHGRSESSSKASGRAVAGITTNEGGLVRRASTVSISARRSAAVRDRTRQRDVRELDKAARRSSPRGGAGIGSGAGANAAPGGVAMGPRGRVSAGAPHGGERARSASRRGVSHGNNASAGIGAGASHETQARRELRRQSSMPARGWEVLQRVEHQEAERSKVGDHDSSRAASVAHLGFDHSSGKGHTDSSLSDAWNIDDGYTSSQSGSRQEM